MTLIKKVGIIALVSGAIAISVFYAFIIYQVI